jgi:glyoxylase-like metal-dependent hydrolase (beta-lactamase superfamily II)
MNATTKIINTALLCLFALLAAPNIFAKEAVGIMDKFKPQKVAEHTWVILGPTSQPNPENQGFMNNPAFVITDKSVIVFDPGSSVQVGRALLKKISKQTDKPITHVFDSHIHGDHWLGNQSIVEKYPAVKIYAHPEMIKEAKAGEAENWINLMNTLTKGATEGTKAVFPSITLKDGQEIQVDNITIKSHFTDIAHTKTDAMFEILQDKVLITGDNAFNNRMPRLDDGSFAGNIKAMDKGLAMDVAVVIPGHGPAGGKEILSNFRTFLSTIYNTSKTLLDDDLESFEMKPVIVKKLEKYKQWDNFEGAIGKLISVAVLEVENE